jgi:hypothetical protein
MYAFRYEWAFAYRRCRRVDVIVWWLLVRLHMILAMVECRAGSMSSLMINSTVGASAKTAGILRQICATVGNEITLLHNMSLTLGRGTEPACDRRERRAGCLVCVWRGCCGLGVVAWESLNVCLPFPVSSTSGP